MDFVIHNVVSPALRRCGSLLAGSLAALIAVNPDAALVDRLDDALVAVGLVLIDLYLSARARSARGR